MQADVKRLPLRKFAVLFAGLLLLSAIPAGAITDCSAVLEENGFAALKRCQAIQREESIIETIEANRKRLDDRRKEILDRFDDYIEDTVDYKEDLDDIYKRDERDVFRTLEDLEKYEAAASVIDLQRSKLDAIRAQRRINNIYYDIYIDILEQNKRLEELKIDLEFAGYELMLRRQSVQ